MNKKETIRALELLDECIDGVIWPEVLLALDSLRRCLMQLWQENGCRMVDASVLLQELSCLRQMCTAAERHPALPTQLCQAMFALYAPAIETEQDIGRQCRNQAERIRSLRRWQQRMSAVLDCYDDETRRETDLLQSEWLMTLEEVYHRCLMIYRSRLAEQAAKLRSARLETICRYRESLLLKDIADAAVQTQTTKEMTDEKIFEFAANISVPGGLLKTTELPQQPAVHFPSAEKPPVRETEGD